MDVGVDCWNYYPISVEQVLSSIEEVNIKFESTTAEGLKIRSS
jgi:hypothetical protein